MTEDPSAGATATKPTVPAARTSPSKSGTRRLGGWEKAEIVGKIMTGLLPAILVAALGLFGQQFAQSLEDNRLYTELLTRREQSDTTLRKDMFKILLEELLAPPKAAGATSLQQVKTIRGQLLNLELLALNFGDTVSLGPLFLKLDEELSQLRYQLKEISDEHVDDVQIGEIDQQITALVNRLDKLASRLSKQQISAIRSGKTLIFQLNIPVAKASSREGFVWPDDMIEQIYQSDEGVDAQSSEQALQLIEAYGTLDCRQVTRRFTFLFTQPDNVKRTVRVKLQIEKIAAQSADQESGSANGSFNPSTVSQGFELDFFNFPMADNIRLSDDQRFALVLTDFDERDITITALCFPWTYSSVLDRAFLNRVIEGLLR